METAAMSSTRGQPPALVGMLERLEQNLDSRLESVVLYGAAARDESYEPADGPLLLIVVGALDPPTMRRLSSPVRFWLRKGFPMPRTFTRSLIADATDVFPVELLEICSHHRVLLGDDPFADTTIHPENLRLQCEREFREKMMRLREAFIECRGTARQLRRLMGESYPSFVDIFRGCLRLVDGAVPRLSHDVVASFCRQAGILQAPFVRVERIAEGHPTLAEVETIFADYYEALTLAIESIDRFQSKKRDQNEQ